MAATTKTGTNVDTKDDSEALAFVDESVWPVDMIATLHTPSRRFDSEDVQVKIELKTVGDREKMRNEIWSPGQRSRWASELDSV